MKSIVRRDDGASYDEHVAGLMKTEGIEDPTPAERQRFDRKRKKSLSNQDWVNPHDPEARITKMKDGRTHLAYKAEHAVDLETGAVVALTVQPGDRGDTASMTSTLTQAGCAVMELAGKAAHPEAVGPVQEVNQVGVERVIADKGYHSKQVLQDLAEGGLRTCLFSLHETALRDEIRQGASDDTLARVIERAIWLKEEGHLINQEGFVKPSKSQQITGPITEEKPLTK